MVKHNQIIKKLLSFSPRQFLGEAKTADYLIGILRYHGLPLDIQKYHVELPDGKGELLCDGRLIPAYATGLKSGKIGGKDNLISSLVSSAVTGGIANLNFNPCCDAISAGNFYNAPALSFSRKDLPRILRAKDVQGRIIVKRKKHLARNIMVGNLKNPHHVFFAHYDSLFSGAIDNAAGVAAMMAAVLSPKSSLEKNLYVFAANEEISFDWPFFWGRGYREFEKKYPEVLKKTGKISVIDCVGNGKTVFVTDPSMVIRAFPVKGIKKLHKKISIITGDYGHLMTVYHSEADDGRGIKQKYLKEATAEILKIAN